MNTDTVISLTAIAFLTIGYIVGWSAGYKIGHGTGFRRGKSVGNASK